MAENQHDDRYYAVAKFTGKDGKAAQEKWLFAVEGVEVVGASVPG
ncbi:hypothetical protein [Mycolicibacterium smegmatis]|nr:hypothetical protein [Mycolicibacterium smegmatis]